MKLIFCFIIGFIGGFFFSTAISVSDKTQDDFKKNGRRKTMPRYIDADALISKLAYHRDGLSRSNVTAVSVLNNVIEIIERRPTISPDEVRGAGTWLRKEKVRHNLDGDGDYRYECSACGHSDEHNENVHVPFCWYCGAKMEVE